MSVAQSAAPATGVRFRHRRRPPILQFALVGAVFVAASSFAASAIAVQVLLLVAAAVLVGLGLLGRSRVWVEDQLITDREVAVVRPDGERGEIPLERLVRVTRRGTSIELVRDDGRKLVFARNSRAKRVRRELAEVAPHVEWTDEVEIACDT